MRVYVYLCAKLTSCINLDECQATATWLCTHAGKRFSSPIHTQAEDELEKGRKGSKSESRALEDKLMHSFTPDFPWDAFEAAANKLKVSTAMGQSFSCSRRMVVLMKFDAGSVNVLGSSDSNPLPWCLSQPPPTLVVNGPPHPPSPG